MVDAELRDGQSPPVSAIEAVVHVEEDTLPENTLPEPEPDAETVLDPDDIPVTQLIAETVQAFELAPPPSAPGAPVLEPPPSVPVAPVLEPPPSEPRKGGKGRAGKGKSGKGKGVGKGVDKSNVVKDKSSGKGKDKGKAVNGKAGNSVQHCSIQRVFLKIHRVLVPQWPRAWAMCVGHRRKRLYFLFLTNAAPRKGQRWTGQQQRQRQRQRQRYDSYI